MKFLLPTFVVIIVAIFAFVVMQNNNCKELEDEKTGICYLRVYDNSYPQICSDSGENGLFSADTVNRIDDIYFCPENRINEDNENSINIISEGMFVIKKYGFKQVSNCDRVYFYIDNGRILSIYAREGFELPELKFENIEQINLEYLNNSAQKTIKNSSDIKALIDNPDKYFSQNQITDIYVKYKNYDFEEWYDKDKLQQATKESSKKA